MPGLGKPSSWALTRVPADVGVEAGENGGWTETSKLPLKAEIEGLCGQVTWSVTQAHDRHPEHGT